MSKVLKLSPNMMYESEPRKIPTQSAYPSESAVYVPEVATPGADSSLDDEREVEVPNLEQIRAEADLLLEEAKAEAERLVHQAGEEAERMRAEARDAGYQDGYSEGLRQAETDMQKVAEQRMSEANAILQRVQEERHRLLTSMAQPLVQISMIAVQQLLKRELTVEPANIEQMVLEILAEVADSLKAEVRVHPDDYHYAIQSHPVWQSVKFGTWDVVVVPDVDINQGGCEVRCDTGRADARIETKLEMLQALLTSFVERSVAEYAAAHLD